MLSFEGKRIDVGANKPKLRRFEIRAFCDKMRSFCTISRSTFWKLQPDIYIYIYIYIYMCVCVCVCVCVHTSVCLFVCLFVWLFPYSNVHLLVYSWTSLIRSPKGKGKWFELAGVQVKEAKIIGKALQVKWILLRISKDFELSEFELSRSNWISSLISSLLCLADICKDSKCVDTSSCRRHSDLKGYDCICPTGWRGNGLRNGTGCTGMRAIYDYMICSRLLVWRQYMAVICISYVFKAALVCG